MLAPRRRPVHLLVTVAFFAFLFFFYRKAARGIYRAQFPGSTRSKSLTENDRANATLGFGAVAVVSKDGSSRRPLLLQAANVTNILLTIPSQPQWTDENVKKFNSSEESKTGPSIGSIYAWLGHHNVLRWFLDSGLETALILEDDVDFDIQLRSLQIPLAAQAARSKLPPAPWNSTLTGKPNPHYWGDPAHWDLLYLGHCGDYFKPLKHGVGDIRADDLAALPHELYVDPTMPARADLHPFTASLFDAFRLPEHTRAFHRSKFPLCTFGYAVTRPAAERLLTDLAPASNPSAEEHFAGAYDVAILKACHEGEKTPSPTPPHHPNPHPHPNPALHHKFASPGLRCWSLNPELFHHMPGNSQIAQIAIEAERTVGIPPVDAAGAEQARARNETSNIRCGFWSGAFAFEEGDSSRLEYLREEVGRKGRCLKGGRERRWGAGWWAS